MQALNMTETTILQKASSKYDSLRTTLPNAFRKHFNLKEGDKLVWDLVQKDGEFVLVIKPDNP